jgi:hypothetical protein
MAAQDHVLRRTNDIPVSVMRSLPALLAAGRCEVATSALAIVQQDVLGLDVTVDDAVTVGVIGARQRPPSRSARPRRWAVVSSRESSRNEMPSTTA